MKSWKKDKDIGGENQLTNDFYRDRETRSGRKILNLYDCGHMVIRYNTMWGATKADADKWRAPIAVIRLEVADEPEFILLLLCSGDISEIHNWAEMWFICGLRLWQELILLCCGDRLLSYVRSVCAVPVLPLALMEIRR